MAYELIYEIAITILGYVFGSIPVAYLVGKIGHGIDIRNYGSGNMGTANVMRTLGKKAGLLTMVLDMLKGAVSILIARIYIWFGNYSGFGTVNSGTAFPKFLDEGFFLSIVALMAIIGHSFPVWLKFKGGKSAAVGAGALLGVNPVAFAIVIFIWFPLLKFTRYMSLSNLLVALISPPLYWFFGGNKWFNNNSLWALIIAFIMVIFVYWRHKANIKRLITGTERKMGEKVEIEKEEQK
ncbi:MAG: glycerol-3-phosphate 1-O-acyltransferase PlsY [Candidatus Heimdallarchaeaceae archaeon]